MSAKSAQRVVCNYSANLTEVFPCFSSVVRQMPGYNSKGARPAFPNHGGLQLKWFPPKVAEAISQSDHNTSGFKPLRAIQLKSSLQRTRCLMGQSPTSSNNPYSENVKAVRRDKYPVSVSTPPVIVLRHLLPFPAMTFVRRNGQTYQGTMSGACARLRP
jgi:hypothetical protein